MSGDVRGRTVEAVALKVLEDRVKARRGEINRELRDMLDPGDRKIAALDSGVKVGHVVYTAGKATARIVDDRALTAWVRENYPDEIVETIRPSFRDMLLGDAAKAHEPVDRRTGEVLPGVEVGQSEPYITVSKDNDGLPALLDSIRAGQLLALDGGDDAHAS